MRHTLLLLSIALPLIGPIIYIIEILHKGVKPHKVTWIIFFIISLLTFSSLLVQQAYSSMYLSLVMLIESFIILILSFRFGIAEWNNTDILALIIAIIGVVVWYITGESKIGTFAGILADFCGLMPTIAKSWEKPSDESYLLYLIDTIASIFNILSTQPFVLKNIIYPIYLLFANLLIVAIIVTRLFLLPKFAFFINKKGTKSSK